MVVEISEGPIWDFDPPPCGDHTPRGMVGAPASHSSAVAQRVHTGATPCSAGGEALSSGPEVGRKCFTFAPQSRQSFAPQGFAPNPFWDLQQICNTYSASSPSALWAARALSCSSVMLDRSMEAKGFPSRLPSSRPSRGFSPRVSRRNRAASTSPFAALP